MLPLNTSRRPLLTVLTLALLTASADAAGLASINPSLKKIDLGLSGYVKVPTQTTIRVPKEFLDKTYLFGGMVEAATDNFLTLGSGSSVLKVRFRVEGDHLLMLADQREFVPDIGASSEDVLNRFPIEEVGDDVDIDFANPEIGGMTFILGGTGYNAQRPGYIYDVETEDGFIAYGEKYIVQSDGQMRDLPAQLTVAIKYFLREIRPSDYVPKTYTNADFAKYGYFLTRRTFRKDNGLSDSKKLVDRWNLNKPIVYTLHPSIPEKFRPAFRDAILSWNRVFKKAVGKEPVEVVIGSDTDIPGHFGKNVLYWVDYETPYGGGAIGPHNSDPDTGEILDADIVFYASAFWSEIASMRREAGIAEELDAEAAEEEANERIRGLLNAAPEEIKRQNRAFSIRMGGQTPLDFEPACSFPLEEDNALTAKAFGDVTGMTDDEAMERIIREVIPHEVGHTLGLRHNFMASTDTANHREGEASTTVMEYQISLQSLVAPGPYDEAAISYGYDGDPSMYEGKSFLFGTDGSNGVDPLSNQFDMGDPFQFYSGKYKHFQKMKAAGYFTRPGSYSRAQGKNLERIRKFVNNIDDEARSENAFQFILSALTDKGTEAPFRAYERIQAMLTLTSDTPRHLRGYGRNIDFAPLNDKQKAAVASAMVQNILPNGPDIFAVRLAMVESLKSMNDIYGYKGLEMLAQAYQQAMAAGGVAQGEDGQPPRQLPLKEQELGLRLQSAVKNYFNQ